MRAALAAVLVLVASCSSHGANPAPKETAGPDTRRADCEKVLAHTWQLIGGDPDSDKLKGAKHEREVDECIAHLTPAARDCVLAATSASQIKPCEALAH